MKRLHKILIALIITLTLAIPLNILASGQDITVTVNGENVVFDAKPIMDNDRILVPVRAIAEKLDSKVLWNEEKGLVSIDDDYVTVEITIDQDKAYVHRKFDFTGIPMEITLDAPARIIDSRTYVPVRFVAESLDLNVNWDENTSTVIITDKPDTLPVERPVSFTKISPDELKSDELKAWYEENNQTRGIYYKTEGDITYILACAGEKPSGGYTIDINDMTMVAQGSLAVTAYVTPPAPDTMVTQALTYPNIIITINENIQTLHGDVADLK